MNQFRNKHKNDSSENKLNRKAEIFRDVKSGLPASSIQSTVGTNHRRRKAWVNLEVAKGEVSEEFLLSLMLSP